MWDHVVLNSPGEGLKRALVELEDVGRRLETVSVRGGGAYNLAWQDWINLQSQTTAAWLIARSALERTESRGSHYRRGFPRAAPEAAAGLAGAPPRGGAGGGRAARRRPPPPPPGPAPPASGGVGRPL